MSRTKRKKKNSQGVNCGNDYELVVRWARTWRRIQVQHKGLQKSTNSVSQILQESS